MLMHDGEDWMRFRMEYESEADGMTVVEKEVPMDYLDLNQLDIFHEIYKECLTACTIADGSEDKVIIQK